MYLTSYLLLIDTLNSHNNLAGNDEHVPLEHVHGLRRGATHVGARGQGVFAAHRDAEGSSGEWGSHCGLVCHVVAAQRFVTSSEISFLENLLQISSANGGKDPTATIPRPARITTLTETNRYLHSFKDLGWFKYHSQPLVPFKAFPQPDHLQYEIGQQISH